MDKIPTNKTSPLEDSDEDPAEDPEETRTNNNPERTLTPDETSEIVEYNENNKNLQEDDELDD